MIRDLIHKQILLHKKKVNEWINNKSQGVLFPFYSSVDIRDSGFKVVPVDANLFPAGFNNICDVDQEAMPEISKAYLKKAHPQGKKVILLTEEHSHNLYYWDNVFVLKELLKNSGLKVQVCVPGKNIKTEMKIESASGRVIEAGLLKDHFHEADFIISNNDFSVDYAIPETLPIDPSPKMGWRYRRKDWFFREYNPLAEEFARLIGLDPFLITIKTKLFEPFHLSDPSNLSKLKKEVGLFLKDIAPVYKKIGEIPYAFLKNNSGTYGLGVTFVGSPGEIENWNSKTRKKMKASKGGGRFSQLILQEGIPTILKDSKESAEPAIYMIGSKLVGGFLRTHKKKGVKENLNSPGAVYKKLCMSDIHIKVEGKKEENVYGWIARLAVLALGFEIKKRS